MASRRDKNGNVTSEVYVSDAQSRARENWRAKQNTKRKGQEKNETARGKRSDGEQLAILDRRLGKGVGAKRERTKLRKRM